MLTLDGVIQAPGGPDEDPSGGFAHGGWVAPYGDADYDQAVQEEMQPADYLLGRKTFKIWEGYWPAHRKVWPGIHSGTKYVFSNTINSSTWEHSTFLRTVEDLKRLKKSTGKDLQVWGSSELVPLLLQHDLVDELRLKIHPLVLGKGKRLFGTTPIPASFTLTNHKVTSKGVILATYARSGKVETGELTGPDPKTSS